MSAPSTVVPSPERRECMSATDEAGRRFGVGDLLRKRLSDGRLGRVVGVKAIWRQGANGTQVHLDLAPDTEYPNHFQGRASGFVVWR